MLIVWGAFVLCFLSLLAYRATVTRYEDDQLFLSEEGSTHAQHNEQEEIFRKVSRLAPMIRIVGGAAGLMTLLIVGTYAWDAIKNLR
jgi:hypothetical protein